MEKIFFALITYIFIASYSIAAEPEYFLVGSVNNNTPRNQNIYFLKKGDALKLYLVVQTDNQFMADIDSFRSGDELIKTTGASSQSIAVSWYTVQPHLQEYSNLWSRLDKNEGNIHIEPIDYERKTIGMETNNWVLDFTNIVGKDNFGTYYLMAEVNTVDETKNYTKTFFSDPSLLSNKYPGKIIQIVYRKDDTYIGYLTELLNTPFIIAPMTTVEGYHETDVRMGSDCAAFAIYGRRRQGYKVPYCGPKWIHKYLTEIEKGALWPRKALSTEIYMNKNNQFVKVAADGGLAVGDIVHFGEQVSVFYEDLGIKGLLDKDDLLLQSWEETPYATTIEKSGFYHKPIRIFKWKQKEKK
jgi:hypothetical protein